MHRRHIGLHIDMPQVHRWLTEQ